MKAETTSPTVATDNVFISATIDAHEGQDVATVDLPGFSCTQTWILTIDNIHMVLRGELTELMVKVNP